MSNEGILSVLRNSICFKDEGERIKEKGCCFIEFAELKEKK